MNPHFDENPAMTDQSVKVGTLTLKNPVLTASGCFGYGLEYEGFFDIGQLGGICTKGLSLHPRLGNPPQRIAETPAGMLNAIGLANVGVEVFCTDKLPRLRDQSVTVVANIFASSTADFQAIAERLQRETGIAAVELNLSCPNVTQGGIEFGKDPDLCFEVTRAVRDISATPLWVKMSPEAGDLRAVAQACAAAGADALSAINTIRGIAVDSEARRFVLANRTGGLSGPAIKPIALRIVWELVNAVSIPIVGIGGVFSAADAIEFLMVGASAIQVGTANFSNPLVAQEIANGIRDYCEQHQLSVEALIGSARPEQVEAKSAP